MCLYCYQLRRFFICWHHAPVGESFPNLLNQLTSDPFVPTTLPQHECQRCRGRARACRKEENSVFGQVLSGQLGTLSQDREAKLSSRITS